MTDPRPIEPGLVIYLGEPDAPARQAIDDLRTYFSTYSGRRFERFAGGGDRAEVRDRFTAEDVVAVSMLSVRIPGRAALEILEQRSANLDRLLAAVPADVALMDADDSVLDDAAEVWSQLTAIPDVEWVTAGKLLARKRPALIPVYDRVVKTVLRREDGEAYWKPLRDLLNGEALVADRLAHLRSESGIGDDISLIRVFDVVTWMHGKCIDRSADKKLEGPQSAP